MSREVQNEDAAPVDEEVPAAGDATPEQDSRGQADDDQEETSSEEGIEGDAPVAEEPSELDKALAAAAESRDRYLRTAAELDNFRKRTVKIRAETRDDTLRDVLLQLAPMLDNFRRALGQETDDLAAFRQGIEILFKQFNEILAGYGLQEIEAEGQPFDPNLHEAMMQVPSPDHEPGTVMQEMEKGYKLNERVVRPARVVVSAASDDGDPDTDETGDSEAEA
jgi:molecular chaperone GrpE